MATTNDKIKNALNAYTPLLRENFKSTFVTLQSGKGLSEQNFSLGEKNKLASVEASAQVNKLENIVFNGQQVSIDNKTATFSISGGLKNISLDGTNVSINNDTAIINLQDTYAKKSDVACVFKYKGTVNQFADLPSGTLNSVGDVWNISLAGGFDKDNVSISAGDNVAFTEDGWDVLAGAIDTSNFVTIQSGKGLSSNDFTTAEKNKLSSIESGAQVNKIENIIINGTQASIDNKTANFSLSGGAASLGSVLSSIDSLSSVSANKFLYTSDENVFATAAVTPFARKLFACTSASELRSYWQGFQDIDFDAAGNSWSVFGNPYMSSKNAKFDKACQFDSNSCLYSDSSFNIDSSHCSICAFFLSNRIPSSSDKIFDSFNSSSNNRIMADLTSDSLFRVRLWLNNSVVASFSSSFSPISLYHFAIIFDSDVMKVYLNGSLLDSLSVSHFDDSFQFFLGMDKSLGYGLFGSLDEFLISNSVLSPAIPSLPYSIDQNTVSLLHFNG